MFNFISALLRRKQSVASITSVFNKQVTQLRDLADAKAAEAETIGEKIDALEDRQEAAVQESFKAAILAGRIEALTKA